jgi:hypothetical protein
MRKRKDRRRPRATAELPFDDLRQNAAERRRLPDRRLENLSAEQRQLLLSEMPGQSASKPKRKD